MHFNFPSSLRRLKWLLSLVKYLPDIQSIWKKALDETFTGNDTVEKEALKQMAQYAYIDSKGDRNNDTFICQQLSKVDQRKKIDAKSNFLNSRQNELGIALFDLFIFYSRFTYYDHDNECFSLVRTSTFTLGQLRKLLRKPLLAVQCGCTISTILATTFSSQIFRSKKVSVVTYIQKINVKDDIGYRNEFEF